MLSTIQRPHELRNKVRSERRDADAAKGIAVGCAIGLALWALPIWLLFG